HGRVRGLIAGFRRAKGQSALSPRLQRQYELAARIRASRPSLDTLAGDADADARERLAAVRSRTNGQAALASVLGHTGHRESHPRLEEDCLRLRPVALVAVLVRCRYSPVERATGGVAALGHERRVARIVGRRLLDAVAEAR